MSTYKLVNEEIPLENKLIPRMVFRPVGEAGHYITIDLVTQTLEIYIDPEYISEPKVIVNLKED